MQEDLLAYVEDEKAYQNKLVSLKKAISKNDLTESQFDKCVDLMLYMFETEAICVALNNDIVYTEKYQEFNRNYNEKNYLSSIVSNLKNKTVTELHTPKKTNNNISISEFTNTICKKTLKDFIKESAIKTYAERVNYKTNKIDRTMLIRAGKSTESYFINILYEYYIYEADKNTDKFNEFYNGLVEAAKEYYNSVEYCVTIGNFFSDKEDLWFTIYQDYVNKKLNNSSSMGAKYEWD